MDQADAGSMRPQSAVHVAQKRARAALQQRGQREWDKAMTAAVAVWHGPRGRRSRCQQYNRRVHEEAQRGHSKTWPLLSWLGSGVLLHTARVRRLCPFPAGLSLLVRGVDRAGGCCAKQMVRLTCACDGVLP